MHVIENHRPIENLCFDLSGGTVRISTAEEDFFGRPQIKFYTPSDEYVQFTGFVDGDAAWIATSWCAAMVCSILIKLSPQFETGINFDISGDEEETLVISTPRANRNILLRLDSDEDWQLFTNRRARRFSGKITCAKFKKSFTQVVHLTEQLLEKGKHVYLFSNLTGGGCGTTYCAPHRKHVHLRPEQYHSRMRAVAKAVHKNGGFFMKNSVYVK